MEYRGRFTSKQVDGKWLPNEYECLDCKEAGLDHEVKTGVPHGCTDQYSCWGAGIPTTRNECMTCHRWDGPWVSADLVGGGW